MATTQYATSSPSASAPALPGVLCKELWMTITALLKDGHALFTNRDFQDAMEQAYTDLTGNEASEQARRQIRTMVQAVNENHPHTYMAQGVQNGIIRAFEEGVRQLNWNVAMIQSSGTRAVRRFSRSESIRNMLEDMNLSPEEIDALDCVTQIILLIQGDRKESPRTRTPRPSPASREDQPPPAPSQEAPPETPAAEAVDPEIQAAIDCGEVDGDEVKRRIEKGEQRRSELENQEIEKVPAHLKSYVDRGVVSEEEADKLRELGEVDQRLKRGEIDEKEAGHIRNSILDNAARDKLERQVREAVAESVKYLQVFEGMKKIDPKFHDALGFLIQHKNLVVAPQGSSTDLSPVVKGLMEDIEILDLVLDIMERKDQEIRMISVRLTPYSAIMRRGLDRIGNMIIEESFVDDLEKLDTDGMSDRLNSTDQLVRVRAAADLPCLISLIDHVTKKTRFRKELRLLRIARQLQEFYDSTSDVKEARHQAENFLNRRLRRLFPGMDTDEAAEIKQRSTEMLDQIEQKVLEVRQEAVESKKAKEEKAEAGRPSTDSGGGGDAELSDDEITKGVVIGRVEMRVAGSIRRIPTKIMPDPDDPSVFVMVTRDPETGDLIPAMRRGSKRTVARGRDGSWRETK